MAFIVKRIYRRPNTDVAFFEEKETSIVDKVRAYVTKTYKNSGKLMNEIFAYSSDRLTMTHTMIFGDNQNAIQFRDDPELIRYFLIRTKYATDNGITISKEFLKV